MSLPNDSNGNLCGYGVTDKYTILYYPDIKDPVTYRLTKVKKSLCGQLPDKK